ncbi:MAG: squalene/phytoene synthase family protein [Chloroflexota bacterium]|nr:squalene/phytoene synthase family protein [Chloroflexota bacterium]
MSRAYEALDNHTPAGSFILDVEACDRINLLKQAYQHCETITKVHSRTFFLASGLLSEAKRHAARALYAFCRFSDDLVDRAVSAPQIALEAWRQRAMSPCPPEDDLVALAWADTRARYEIPRLYAEQLIEGVARDLTKMRYNTFHELAEYAYGVASTVGLMAMHIIGFSGPEAVPYAIRLGVALQLTNILRDVGEDWRSGRLYIPQDELAAFGLTEADIAAGRVDDRWRALMRFQIERNRRLYAESMPGIGLLHSDGRFAIAAAAELYRAILEDIEAHDMDVFNRRAQVSQLGKLRRLLGIWTRARRAHPAQATIA